MAEDYAPFDVDVTTEDLAYPAATTARCAIGGTNAWYGSGNGVSYVGAWGQPYYQPSFVFSQSFGVSNPKYIWEAVSHEL